MTPERKKFLNDTAFVLFMAAIVFGAGFLVGRMYGLNECIRIYGEAMAK